MFIVTITRILFDVLWDLTKFYTFTLHKVSLYGTLADGLRTETCHVWVHIKYRLHWTDYIVLFIWLYVHGGMDHVKFIESLDFC
jgi:hypothetical protein